MDQIKPEQTVQMWEGHWFAALQKKLEAASPPASVRQELLEQARPGRPAGVAALGPRRWLVAIASGSPDTEQERRLGFRLYAVTQTAVNGEPPTAEEAYTVEEGSSVSGDLEEVRAALQAQGVYAAAVEAAGHVGVIGWVRRGEVLRVVVRARGRPPLEVQPSEEGLFFVALGKGRVDRLAPIEVQA